MAQTPRTTPRTGAARFGRTPTPAPGRFARTGTARTGTPRTSTARPRRTPAGSMSRSPSPFARPRGGKSKKQKGLGGTLTGLLPTGAAAKATPSSKTGKAGGFAALAGLAGLAFRNRDKLSAMAKNKRGGGDSFETTVAPASGQAPLATPVVEQDNTTPPSPRI